MVEEKTVRENANNCEKERRHGTQQRPLETRWSWSGGLVPLHLWGFREVSALIACRVDNVFRLDDFRLPNGIIMYTLLENPTRPW